MSNSGMEMIVWKTWFISFFIDIQFVMKITNDFLHNLPELYTTLQLNPLQLGSVLHSCVQVGKVV